MDWNFSMGCNPKSKLRKKVRMKAVENSNVHSHQQNAADTNKKTNGNQTCAPSCSRASVSSIVFKFVQFASFMSLKTFR